MAGNETPAAALIARPGVCSRCGSTDSPKPLPKRYACRTCGPRLLCYACDVQHGTWCGEADRG